jgi:hypothetical protein
MWECDEQCDTDSFFSGYLCIPLQGTRPLVLHTYIHTYLFIRETYSKQYQGIKSYLAPIIRLYKLEQVHCAGWGWGRHCDQKEKFVVMELVGSELHKSVVCCAVRITG